MSTGRWSDLDRPPLRQGALAAALTSGPDAAWRRIEVVPETGSTNADLVARAAAGEPDGVVLVAEHQVAGRGRLARSWTTPPRSSVTVSVLLRPGGVPADRLGWLPLLGGLAVVDALTGVCGVPARLKWPNDVMVAEDVPDDAADADIADAADTGDTADSADADRKVCGVLAEVVPSPAALPGSGSAVVLGVGINVTQTRAELPVPTATSLRLAGASTTDRDTVLRAYLRALAVRYRAFVTASGDPGRSGLAADYRAACSTLGRRVQVQLPAGAGGDGLHQGTAEAVDDDGRLLVRVGDQVRPFAAGDVVHLRRAAGRA